jgi:hypothetical protein
VDLVYIHIGKKSVPLYFWETIKQTRRFYNGNIYVILQEKEMSELYYNVIGIKAEDLDSRDNQEFSRLYSFMNDRDVLGDFWFVTAQRFFLLETFMRKYNKRNIIHLEYDNIVYTDLNQYENVFKEHYKNSVAIGPVSDTHDSAGFIYIDNCDNLKFINERMLEYLRTYTNKDELLTEMIMLKYYANKFPTIIKYYPVLPFDEKYSNNIEYFNSIFDPATWGQFIGGRNKPIMGGHENPGKKSVSLDHRIGKELLNDTVKIVWEYDSKYRKCPFVVDINTNTKWKLNNLHIHSKELSKYV